MPDLHFEILSADVKPHAAIPTIVFKLQIRNEVENEEVYAVGLKSQLRIEAMYRKYNEETKQRLVEVFGQPERWTDTLKSLYWKLITISVPRFTGQTVVDVALECSEDMAAAVGKYMYSIEDGTVPLAFVFSGTIFYKSPQESLQITQVPWDKETSFEMPISLWNNLLDVYFPDSKWLRIPKDVFDKLYAYKSKSAYPTLNRCLEALIDQGLESLPEIEKEKLGMKNEN